MFQNLTLYYVFTFEVQGKSSILQTRHGAPMHGVGGLYCNYLFLKNAVTL
jgi:hypothetical protein